MAKPVNPHRYQCVPGYVAVTDDFGLLHCYRKIEDVESELRRPATPAEKEAIAINLEWLQARVEVDEDSGCWVWQGYISKQGQPQCRISVATFVNATMLVRRLVLRMAVQAGEHSQTSTDFLRERQAGVPKTCVHGCCSPEHVVARTKKQAMAPTRGKPKTNAHRANISRSRSAASKISDADIRKILADPRPGTEVAKELGVHASYVPHVRTGKLRAYSATGMFAGLLAQTRRTVPKSRAREVAK